MPMTSCMQRWRRCHGDVSRAPGCSYAEYVVGIWRMGRRSGGLDWKVSGCRLMSSLMCSQTIEQSLSKATVTRGTQRFHNVTPQGIGHPRCNGPNPHSNSKYCLFINHLELSLLRSLRSCSASAISISSSSSLSFRIRCATSRSARMTMRGGPQHWMTLRVLRYVGLL